MSTPTGIPLHEGFSPPLSLRVHFAQQSPPFTPNQTQARQQRAHLSPLLSLRALFTQQSPPSTPDHPLSLRALFTQQSPPSNSEHPLSLRALFAKQSPASHPDHPLSLRALFAQQSPPTLIDQKQFRLLSLAALFLFLYSTVLTLSPAARLRSWDVPLRWDHWLGFALWILAVSVAHWQSSRCTSERDPFLLPVAALLSGWGMLTIWRLSPYFGLRQSLWLFASLCALTLGLRLPSNLSYLRRYKYIWLTSGLLLTALTLVFGTNPTGPGLPRLWLGCCGFYLQPSEPLKLLLIVYLSSYLATSFPTPAERRNNGEGSFRFTLASISPTLLMSGLAMLLLIVQRDLGTAVVFLFLYAVIVYLATGNRWIILASGLVVLISALTGYLLFDVVRLRLEAWFNPWLDPSGRSFQIVQSLLAVASGGVFGRGPGLGNPGLVPVPHSDFIFAAIAEESGLVGAFGLLILLALLAVRGLDIALHAPDAFRRCLAAGLTAHLVAQSVLIIGGNLRLLPLTGVTLPFVSYGGSSLLTSFLSLLFLLQISRREDTPPYPLPSARPYLQLGGLLFAGLVGASLVSGWWAIVRGPDLLTRTDNVRRAIADRFVPRGTLLDRNNQPLALTIGQPGTYIRRVLYPDLSPVLGYNSPVYGQSGLEASFDLYLRGQKGYPGLTLWWSSLQYGQPPPGLDLRTSLDLDMQRTADQLLGSHPGALVLLNAKSGEILAMASHPTFDANQLTEQWQTLVTDPSSPLLDRASLGRYSAGDLLQKIFPDGLPGSLLDVTSTLGLPSGAPSDLNNPSSVLSPLEMAVLIAALSNHGLSQPPVLVSAVNTPTVGWVILPSVGKPVQLLSETRASQQASVLSASGLSFWQATTLAPNGSGHGYAWYVGGTLPGWNGIPISLALILEEANQTLVAQIGEQVIKAAMGYK
jgi:cell division protein FtsW (lipid II flippase)